MQPIERSVFRRRTTRAEARADDEVFAEVYPRLRRFAGAVGSVGIEPDDLVQDAVANTLRHHRLAELDHPLAYLRRAVLTAAIGQQRRRDTRRRIDPTLAPEYVPAPVVYPSDLADLEHLDPRDRAILYLVDVEGRSYEETADLLDENAQNARLRASRARRRLRSLLTGETDTEQPGEGGSS